MSKRKARQQKKAATAALASRRKRKIVVVIALLLCLGLAGGILARLRATRIARINALMLSPAPTAPPPSSPSKEYIYAGGRLLATEETTATQSSGSVENVIWTNVVGATASGNTLTKNSNIPADWGNSGAVSVQTIPSGDGYMEFTATEANTHRMCGLSNGDTTQSYGDIDFAIYPWANGSVSIYEAGINRGTFGTYAAGDRFRVAVEGGVVKYWKNSTLIYTSTVAPTYPLSVDTSLYNNNASIGNAVIARTLPSTNVTWTNVVGATASGNSLTKTVVPGWGNSGASSTRALASGDGYMEFTATEANTHRMCGLSNGDTTQSYGDIDFAIYPWANGSVSIYEAGINRGTFGTYAAGDRFRVAVEGGVVKYYKNGTLLYSSTVAPTYPLLVDTSLYTEGSTITNAILSGTLTP